jgi:hypothetical protein
MWNNLCDDEHDAHAMQSINRVVMVILVTFMSFGGFAISTRLGAVEPPASVAYGTEQPTPDAAVMGD